MSGWLIIKPSLLYPMCGNKKERDFKVIAGFIGRDHNTKDIFIKLLVPISCTSYLIRSRRVRCGSQLDLDYARRNANDLLSNLAVIE